MHDAQVRVYEQVLFVSRDGEILDDDALVGAFRTAGVRHTEAGQVANLLEVLQSNTRTARASTTLISRKARRYLRSLLLWRLQTVYK